MILNAIVAADKNNAIGNTKREDVDVSLPWRLAKEFEYFMKMCDFKKGDSEKRTMLVCGPLVHKEHFTLTPNGMDEFYYVVVSKSIKEKPANCHILTDDYSFTDLLKIVKTEYKDKVSRIIVLGGVPLYNTMMSSPFKCRFFWTRIDAEFDADRRMRNLDMEKWTEQMSRDIEDFPPLPDTTNELEQLTGKTVSWRVHVYENFSQ